MSLTTRSATGEPSADRSATPILRRRCPASPAQGDWTSAGTALGAAAIGVVADAGAARLALAGAGRAARLLGRACGSFGEETAVTTPEGLTPIGELKIGDRVLARSEETGIYAFEPIIKVFRHRDPVKVYLTLADRATGAAEVIETTPEHPFYIPGRGFVPARFLKPDDSVSRAPPAATSVVRLMSLRSDTSVLRVKALTFEHQAFWAYNLEVGKDHTFFVGVERAWVYNVSCSIFLRDFATENTVNRSARYGSEREARNLARTKLGSNPLQVEPGKLRSQDGRWQYRAKPSDLAGHGW
jgi:hypothetical protein